jgi:predicted nuclease of restriction endonuclease-like (RecB) superfamily
MLGQEAHERDLGALAADHLRKFLLELGVGFAFAGSQYRLQIGGEEFFIDLLFYLLKLRACIVIDLKVQAFRAEFCRQDEPVSLRG